ncbi:MAG TPA: hypothetical protein VMT55_04080 [Candidatus Sulfotelmatobacter sp.]|nr:hypothetical protein [Candidatus Sulfotelmatobacter sp.]
MTAPSQVKSLYSRTLDHPRFSAVRTLGRAFLMIQLCPMIFNFIPPIVPVLIISSAVELIKKGRKGV